MKLAPVASMLSAESSILPSVDVDDVVEIGILLPTKRAVALIEAARARQESVGQMVRRLIDRELLAARAAN